MSRSTSDPYVAPGEDGDAWRAQAAEHGQVGSQELLRAGVIEPGDTLRAAMELPEGAQVVIRRRLIRADGRPVEVATSWYPATIAAGTPLAGPGKIKGGAVRALADAGHAPVDVTEVIDARHPTAEEAAVLDVPGDEPMLELVRINRDAAGAIVEYAVNVSVARLSPPHVDHRYL
jgi:GntR family transcriptional regulator